MTLPPQPLHTVPPATGTNRNGSQPGYAADALGPSTVLPGSQMPGSQIPGSQPPSSQVPGERPQTAGGGWYVAMIIAAVLVVFVGLIEPAWAPRLALICLVMAAAVVAGNWLRTVLSTTVPDLRFVDTDIEDETTRSAPTPLAVAELVEPHAPAWLSPRGMQYLRFIASERLWTAYGLNLAHQPHWAEIRRRVSPELWQTINYQLRPTNESHPDAQLSRLLNEIERI